MLDLNKIPFTYIFGCRSKTRLTTRVVETYNPRGGRLKKFTDEPEGFQEHGFEVRQALFDDIEFLIYPESK